MPPHFRRDDGGGDSDKKSDDQKKKNDKDDSSRNREEKQSEPDPPPPPPPPPPFQPDTQISGITALPTLSEAPFFSSIDSASFLSQATGAITFPSSTASTTPTPTSTSNSSESPLGINAPQLGASASEGALASALSPSPSDLFGSPSENSSSSTSTAIPIRDVVIVLVPILVVLAASVPLAIFIYRRSKRNTARNLTNGRGVGPEDYDADGKYKSSMAATMSTYPVIVDEKRDSISKTSDELPRINSGGLPSYFAPIPNSKRSASPIPPPIHIEPRRLSVSATPGAADAHMPSPYRRTSFATPVHSDEHTLSPAPRPNLTSHFSMSSGRPGSSVASEVGSMAPYTVGESRVLAGTEATKSPSALASSGLSSSGLRFELVPPGTSRPYRQTGSGQAV